ncbi:MAG: hypothetical protein MR016_06675 [Agathobacter sp.]|nr:hypothetical protein [Agathobacter sp.]
MRMQLKSYRAFVAQPYRAIEIWGLSAILLAAYWLLAPRFGTTALIICYSVYIQLDMTWDFWIFGGICPRNSAKMEFVKSSCYGYTGLKMAILTDQMRRFVMFAILSVGLMAITVIREDRTIGSVELWYTALLILAPYAVNTLLLNISRHIEFFQLYILVPCAGCGFVAGLLAAFGEQLSDGTLVTVKQMVFLVILLLLGIIGTAVTIWHMLFCIKRSYRDAV